MTSQLAQATIQMQQKKKGLGTQKQAEAKKNAIFQQISMTLHRQKCHLSTNKHDVATRENAVINQCDIMTAQASMRRLFSLISDFLWIRFSQSYHLYCSWSFKKKWQAL